MVPIGVKLRGFAHIGALTTVGFGSSGVLVVLADLAVLLLVLLVEDDVSGVGNCDAAGGRGKFVCYRFG